MLLRWIGFSKTTSIIELMQAWRYGRYLILNYGSGFSLMKTSFLNPEQTPTFMLER
jgi:hypothetical protein